MAGRNSFEVLNEESPQVAEAFNSLIQAVASTGVLDAKTRQLIFIGIMASQGDCGAVAAHVPMAKASGATRAEVRDTILMTLPISGVQGITHCLVPALAAYEN